MKRKKTHCLTRTRRREQEEKKRKRIRTSKVNIDKPGTYNQASGNDRRMSLRKPIKAEVSEEDVQKQIKETLARLTEKKEGKKRRCKIPP